jgi:protein SCO1/2
VLLLAGCGGEPEYTAHDITGVMSELAFELTNEQGKPVTEDDYDGRLKLLFFGYTNCPDICPATMARIRAALGGLDDDVRDDVDVLFLSVDPERDTPKRLKQYTESFGEEFVGLTGSQDQLKTLTKRYRVTYGYGKPNDNGFYLVSHSSAIFVFGPDGRARLLANQTETVDELTADLKKLLVSLE